MADVHDKLTRSYNMSRILAKNTTPEFIVRKALWRNNFRYRLHVKHLPGRPDIVLARYKSVIRVHGCFWHGHSGCKYYTIPTTRSSWWQSKINRTKELDVINAAKLLERGWNVIDIWECDLKSGKIDRTIDSLVKQLKSIK